MAGANGVFTVPVFFRAEWTKLVYTWSFVERLDLLPMAVLLRSGGKLPARGVRSAHGVGPLPAAIDGGASILLCGFHLSISIIGEP